MGLFSVERIRRGTFSLTGSSFHLPLEWKTDLYKRLLTLDVDSIALLERRCTRTHLKYVYREGHPNV